MKNDEEAASVASGGCGGNDEEHVVLTPDLLSPGSGARPDGIPLLGSTCVLEIATEPLDGYPSEFRQSSLLHRLCSSEGRLHVCGVFSLAVCVLIVVASWLGTKPPAADNATGTLAPPVTPPITYGIAFATTSYVKSRLLFRYTSAEDSLGTEPPTRRLAVASSVNLTISPQDVTDSIMIQLPQATYSSLMRLQVVGMDTSCDRKGTMCLCQSSIFNESSFPPDMSWPFSECVADCSYVLKQSSLPPSVAYSAADWYQLLVPCTLQPDRQYVLEVLSTPDSAFQPTEPYLVSQQGSASSSRKLQQGSDEEATNNQTQWLESGLMTSSQRFEPSTLAVGSHTAFHRLVATVPEGLKVLASAEEERSDPLPDGSVQVTFKELQGWSPSMLAVAVGRFDSLAAGSDSQGRRLGVWALPGGAPEDGQLALHVLNTSIPAWENFTGHELQELAKLDMLVSNGASPWSMSQFGLLFMDRFRTLWNADFSSASDLVRAAHITCHEAGHHWFGGVLQTLNQTSFIEESTTSYGEVFCVSKVLPKAFSNVLAFERAFFPEFGDTRSIHVGAEFHAINNLAAPAHAKDSVQSSSAAFYTKGAALLHMLDSYADSSVREGLVRGVIKDMFGDFHRQAVTQDTLLCLLAMQLAGCSAEDLGDSACSATLSALIPVPTEDTEDDADATTDSSSTSSSSSPPEEDQCSALLDRWLVRLRDWVLEPGLQQVELHVSDAPESVSGALLQTYQAQLLPNGLPGQADSQTPMWVPVSVTASAATHVHAPGNSSAQLIESRWLEIFPVWEAQHRVAAGSKELCAETDAAEGDGNTCARPLASPPAVIDNGTVPWLMKGEPGAFLSNIAATDAGQAHKRQLESALRHLSLTLNEGYDMHADDPELKLVLAFASLIHDQRVLFKARPTEEGLSFLKLLVEAAFTAKATSQAGVASYLLLGAATVAVQDLFQLARGNEDCHAALSQWEAATITHRGNTLWSRARSRSKEPTGFADITQDMLFSRIAAAHVVPRAVLYDAELAASVCGVLPEAAVAPGDLLEAYHAMPYAPDVRNMVLETAIVASSACDGAGWLEESLVRYLQASAGEGHLMCHLQRSLVFMLASSANTTTLQWLVDTVVLEEPSHAQYGLRQVDKPTLLRRIVRSPPGFQVSSDTLRRRAANLTSEEWDGQNTMVQLAGIVAAASAQDLTDWLPDTISHAAMQALQLEKDSDRLGSEIVCLGDVSE